MGINVIPNNQYSPFFFSFDKNKNHMYVQYFSDKRFSPHHDYKVFKIFTKHSTVQPTEAYKFKDYILLTSQPYPDANLFISCRLTNYAALSAQKSQLNW